MGCAEPAKKCLKTKVLTGWSCEAVSMSKPFACGQKFFPDPQHIWTAHLQIKNCDSLSALKFGQCECLQNVLVDSLKWHVVNIWVNKQHLDLHLLFSHNQDSYKYLLRGQNHRSSQHCSQIKGCFWLPGHDECTIIKQFQIKLHFLIPAHKFPVSHIL